MPNELSDDTQSSDLHTAAATAASLQAAIASKFGVPLHNVVTSAEITEHGSIEISFAIYWKNENRTSNTE